MSEAVSSIQNNQSQLPSINQSQTDPNKNSTDDLDRSQDENNVLPLTHANKKRRHRKKFRKHSPEYYEQKKQLKLNKKLEQRWDSHFINDQIPDLFNKRKNIGKTLSKLKNDKRSITALDNNGFNTVGITQKKETLPLPRIQKASKRSKSFNVHVIAQKAHQPSNKQIKGKLEKQIQSKQKLRQTIQKPIEVKRNEQIQQKSLSHVQHPQKRKKTSQQSKRPFQQTKQNSYLEQYKKAINELFEDKKFLHCHKQVLQSFLDSIERKVVRDMIQKQMNLIKKKESSIFKIMNAITNRQSFLEKVKATGDKLVSDSNNKEILELIDNYRTSTLAVVQEILKWKQTWNAVYSEVYKKSRNFDLVYKTQNYFLTMMSSTDSILQMVYSQNQPSIEASNKQKTQQQIPEQKETPIHQNQNKQQTQTGNKPTQLNVVSQPAQQKSPVQNPVKQSNSPPKESKPKTEQAQKTTIKTQNLIDSHKITSNDPFLVSLNSIEKEDKNIILKIRACELLLIEQSYNFLKR